MKLVKIFEIQPNIQIYMDECANVHWSYGVLGPLPLSAMPKWIQVHFLVKFIQDHDLAERTKMIKDPVVCIELYIKGKFMNNEPLGIH